MSLTESPSPSPVPPLPPQDLRSPRPAGDTGDGTWRHFSVVMSSCSVTTLGMGLMGTRSTPGLRETPEPLKRGSSPSQVASPPSSSSSQDPQPRIPFPWHMQGLGRTSLSPAPAKRHHSPMIRLDTGMNLEATWSLGRTERSGAAAGSQQSPEPWTALPGFGAEDRDTTRHTHGTVIAPQASRGHCGQPVPTHHPPGAAHRSSRARAFCRNWNFRLSWSSLKEERERKPGGEQGVIGVTGPAAPLFPAPGRALTRLLGQVVELVPPALAQFAFLAHGGGGAAPRGGWDVLSAEGSGLGGKQR